MSSFAAAPPAARGPLAAPSRPGAGRTCALAGAFLSGGRPVRATRRAPAAVDGIRFEAAPRAEAASDAREEAKRALLALIEADPHANRSAILQAARRLERQNPNPEPAASARALFDGNWELEWTSGERTRSARQRRSINDLARRGGVLQPIAGAAGGEPLLQNVVDFFGLRFVLEGPWEAVDGSTIRFTFTSARVKPWALPALRLPLKDVGWGSVRHTYLDGEVRLGWGDSGGLAVYTKRPAPADA